MDRIRAIYNTHANTVRTNDEGAWDKDDKLISLDESAITTEMSRLQAEWNAQAYARSRQAEYPPWDEQLDHIYHNGVASWKANVVKPVKDKYPKPS